MRPFDTGTHMTLLILDTLPRMIGVLSGGNLVNVTVDDSSPDPLTGNSISYSGNWSLGQFTHCSSCLAQPDTSKAHSGSWHNATYNGDEYSYNVNKTGVATFNFTGKLSIQTICYRLVLMDLRLCCICVWDP